MAVRKKKPKVKKAVKPKKIKRVWSSRDAKFPTIENQDITQFVLGHQEHKSLSRSKLKVMHFIGIALGGGKTDKSAFAKIDFYPSQNKIFLSVLKSKIKNSEVKSGDQQIFELVEGSKKVQSIAFNTPIQVPKCMRCRLKCPGYEKCKEPEIKWMWSFYKKRNTEKRPRKLFTPYTERCTELFISSEFEESFYPPHALGANAAPLTARAHFLLRRLKGKPVEVYPKLSLWRIGRSLGILKSPLRKHKHSVDGLDNRAKILEKLVDKDVAFIYQQDVRTMIEDNQAFEAFLCGLTAVLKYRGQTEKRPKSFPKSEIWPEIPVKQIVW